MLEIFEILQSPWAMRALIASSLVGTMCGALGAFIVLRNMSLIGDALAHAILPGIVVAFVLVGYSSLGFFIGAVAAGLLTAAAITWIQQRAHTKNDAAIGIVFTAMFALGVIGISKLSKSDGVHLDLKDFLFGNVLGVSNADIQMTTVITVIVLAAITLFYRYLFVSTFQPVVAAVMGIRVNVIHYLLMLLLSFAVVASLRTVGVILVVAMLITPASTALLWSNRLKSVIALSALLGLASAVSGLILAIYLDTTPGPAMAVVVTLFYLISMMVSPEKGLIFTFFRKRKMTRKIELEDLMKRTFHLQNKKSNSLENLVDALGWNASKVRRTAQVLQQKKWGLWQGDQLHLTPSGTELALGLIRAHRLYESYLVQDVGLEEGQIHEEAERLEHILTDDQVDALDKYLGYPEQDPHGSPIPEASGSNRTYLSDATQESQVTISSRQRNVFVTNQLWKMGLTPGEPISILDKQEDQMTIKSSEGDSYTIDSDLCSQIEIQTQ